MEGALPVIVIDRAQIEASGEISVADFLRSSSFNSFGSPVSTSGNTGLGRSFINLRGLGAGCTLMLIDGRRAPVSPQIGSGNDLNTIPLAAVERFEILSDGASAIYGSDAIGGVINVITRKDFEGTEINYGRGYPRKSAVQVLIYSSFQVAPCVQWSGRNIGLDYYNIKVTNRVVGIGVVETEGYDLSARTAFALAGGRMSNRLQMSYVSKYQTDSGENVSGRVSNPRMRGTLSNSWSIGNVSVNWNINYIHGTQSQAWRDIVGNDRNNRVTRDAIRALPTRLPSWLTHNVQVTWEAPWDARVSLGVTNLADKEAVIDPYAGDDFDSSLYNTWGRTPYFRYTQTF